jgi:multidrug resistance protein
VPRPDTAEVSTRTRLSILFLAVFVDLVGFGIVLPLLPLYADGFGASGLVVGLLVSVYSVAQLFMAPIWGRLSDRFGRRPILILGLLGSAISYLVFAYARTITALFVSRALAGIGGATVPVAQAYIADVSTARNRAGRMGLIGAAFGLGFIFGPAIGGLLAPVSLAAPGLAAAGLCFANVLLALALLPESLPAEARRVQHSRSRRWRELGAALRSSDLRRLLVLYFFFTVAFATMQPTFSLFGAQRFGLDARSVGYLFAYLGLISAAVQGGLVRRVAPRLGEARLIRWCGPPFVAGLALVALSPSIGVVLLALTLLAVGFGGTLPSVTSLVSQRAPEHLQGAVLGLGQSVGSLARIVGPVMAGWAFDGLGIGSPYLIGAGVGLLAFIVALSVVQPAMEPQP